MTLYKYWGQHRMWHIWASGRSVHHSRVDGNLMGVAERENSSLLLSLPIAHPSSKDSIRQPSDCELILSLSVYCQPTAYYYCCHFLVTWHDNLSVYCSNVAFKAKHIKCIAIDFFHRREHTTAYSMYLICTHVHIGLCRRYCAQPLLPDRVFLLPPNLRFPQLFMSHLLGQALCQMCVKQDLICPLCSSSNCVLVCMLKLLLMPLQHPMVGQGTPA